MATQGNRTGLPAAQHALGSAGGHSRDRAVCAQASQRNGSSNVGPSYASQAGAMPGPSVRFRRRIESDDEDDAEPTDGATSANSRPAEARDMGTVIGGISGSRFTPNDGMDRNLALEIESTAGAASREPCAVDRTSREARGVVHRDVDVDLTVEQDGFSAFTVEEAGRACSRGQPSKQAPKDLGPSRPSCTHHTAAAQIQKELREACRAKDLSAMRRLIAKGASVNAPDPKFEETPLNTCVKASFVEGLKLLIDLDRRRKWHPDQQPVDVNKPSNIRTEAGDSLGMDAENRSIRPIDFAYKVRALSPVISHFLALAIIT